MRFYFKLLIISVVLIFSSCAFKNSFYHPTKELVDTPPEAKSAYVQYGENDSIQSLFYTRDNAKASLFILHGNAGNLSSWSEVADLFFQAGYQVFIIDYPGFGNSSGEAEHKTVKEASNAAVNHFNSLPEVLGTKKIILGYSLGGNLAIKVAHDHPTLFDALLIEGAFDSHRNVAMSTFIKPLRFIPAMFVKNEVNGNELLATWNKPLLIIHSKDDMTCPYRMGVSLYENAVGTAEKELWTIKGPHLSGLSRNFDLYLAKVAGLVSKINPN